MVRAFAALVVSLIIAVTAQAQEGPEFPLSLRGVELGMELTEAKKVLREHYAEATFDEVALPRIVHIGNTPCAVTRWKYDRDFRNATSAQRDRIKAKFERDWMEKGCAKPGRFPVEFTYSIDAEFPDGRVESVELYMAGLLDGAPRIAAVYLKGTPDEAPEQLPSGVSRYNVDGNADHHVYLTQHSLASAFSRWGDKTCRELKPKDVTLPEPNVRIKRQFPREELQVDCGRYLRASSSESLLIDTQFSSNALGRRVAKITVPPTPNSNSDTRTSVATASRLPQGLLQADQKYQKAIGAIEANVPFQWSDAEFIFVGGLTSGLLQQCNLDISLEDRAELTAFSYAASARGGMGNDFTNPDIGSMMANQLSGTAILAAGLKTAEWTECAPGVSQAAENIANLVRSNTRGPGGGTATFIQTCEPVHGDESCQCLGRVGSAVVPNIFQTPYSSSLVARIIQGNPIFSIQILACGIMDY